MCPFSSSRVSSAVLPLWSFSSTPASGRSGRLLLLLFVLPWWMAEGVRWSQNSSNKLSSLSDLPDLKMFHPVLLFPCRRGGGREVAGRKNQHLHRAEQVVRSWSPFSVVFVREQRRLPDSGVRLPIPFVMPPTLLVEWQPSSSSSRLTCLRGGSSKQAEWLRLFPPAGCWRWSCSEPYVAMSPAALGILC